MVEPFDLAIVGAGPAGMACAVAAREAGRRVVVIDEQPTPGGQVWRGIEAAGDFPRPASLWSDLAGGQRTVAAFRASGAEYLPGTQVFQIEPGWRLFLNGSGGTRVLAARRLVLATGAMERPVVFSGWTLPGVMTVGAGQILLKRSGLVPDGPVWLAGYGPLLLLYAVQLLAAGGQVAGMVDTRPRGGGWPLRAFAGAVLRSGGDLAKGAWWMARLRLARVPVFEAASIAADGHDRLEAVVVTSRSGQQRRFPARLLLVHEGLVPRTHDGLLAGADYRWDLAQGCLAPETGPAPAGATLQVIGDAARIAGARAALASGRLAGAGAPPAASAEWRKDIALRRFLDAFYPPRPLTSDLPDDALVCRCEEVTAGDIRAAARATGIDQIKSGTRAGMGRCQGRQCAAAVARLHALSSGLAEAEHQTYRVRPPLKPVRMGDLASLAAEEGAT